MIQDRLSVSERIRLEALNQAVTASIHTPILSDELIINKARKFEAFIKGEVND